ncbi:hypothetical protein WJX72_012287 [[Myrmecia] bisecta]|uniref:Uncharacterized protein n=1 Tax=[Myrmecia] bisecta TaxID=41462 RepID=A0AAW1QQM6_9CHLO
MTPRELRPSRLALPNSDVPYNSRSASRYPSRNFRNMKLLVAACFLALLSLPGGSAVPQPCTTPCPGTSVPASGTPDNCAECKCPNSATNVCNRNVNNGPNSCNGVTQATINTKCGGGGNEPVLTGFDGITFEFVGKADTWFNLVSEKEHVLNARMKSANMKSKAHATVIDSVALKYKEISIVTTVDDAAALTVVVNGERTITKEDLQSAPNHAIEVQLDDEDATVVVELFRDYYGHSVRIITPLLDTTVFATPAGLDDYYQEYLPAYLNFDLSLRQPAVQAIHGLLGQTAPYSIAAKPKPTSASARASIELFNGHGVEDDYIVSSALSTDFKFSQVGKAQQVLKLARRSLSETTVPQVFVATWARR